LIVSDIGCGGEKEIGITKYGGRDNTTVGPEGELCFYGRKKGRKGEKTAAEILDA